MRHRGSRKPNGVFRTIRDGCVTIYGRTYRPAERSHPTSIPYTGQLDGQRWYFGLYWGPYSVAGTRLASFVSLWGTEAAAKAKDEAAMKEHWPGPNCINGYFQWEWWNAELNQGADVAPTVTL